MKKIILKEKATISLYRASNKMGFIAYREGDLRESVTFLLWIPKSRRWLTIYSDGFSPEISHEEEFDLENAIKHQENVYHFDTLEELISWMHEELEK